MYIINIILAIWGPHLAGSLTAAVRKKKTLRMLKAIGLGEREEMAGEVRTILGRKHRDEAIVGWSLVGIFIISQFLLPGPIWGKWLGILITTGVGLNRMIRDLPYLVLNADEGALREEVKLGTVQGEKVRSESLIMGAAGSEEPTTLLFSVEWLVKWRSPWAVQFLREIGEQSLNYEIRNLCHSGYEGGRDLLEKEDPTHILSLRELVDQSLYWRRVAMSFQQKDEHLWRGTELEGLEKDLVEAFQAQGELVAAHPFNYCLDGDSRCEISQIQGWKYVLGRLSQDYRNTVVGAFKVVGRIGPKTPEKLHNGELRLNLWDPVQQTARAVELDELEVIKGEEINYDWAVSATIEVLQNRSTHGELRIEVNRDGEISLTPNTLNLLRQVSK